MVRRYAVERHRNFATSNEREWELSLCVFENVPYLVGNAYLIVQDTPNLIGKMSGHTDGSRAFVRYRNIEDETLRSVIEKME